MVVWRDVYIQPFLITRCNLALVLWRSCREATSTCGWLPMRGAVVWRGVAWRDATRLDVMRQRHFATALPGAMVMVWTVVMCGYTSSTSLLHPSIHSVQAYSALRKNRSHQVQEAFKILNDDSGLGDSSQGRIYPRPSPRRKTITLDKKIRRF